MPTNDIIQTCTQIRLQYCLVSTASGQVVVMCFHRLDNAGLNVTHGEIVKIMLSLNALRMDIACVCVYACLGHAQNYKQFVAAVPCQEQ